MSEEFTPDDILAAGPCQEGWAKYRASGVFANSSVSMREGIEAVGLNEALWLGKLVADRESFMAFGRAVDAVIPRQGHATHFNRYNGRRAKLTPELVALGAGIAIEMKVLTREQIIVMLERADKGQL